MRGNEVQMGHLYVILREGLHEDPYDKRWFCVIERKTADDEWLGRHWHQMPDGTIRIYRGRFMCEPARLRPVTASEKAQAERWLAKALMLE